MSSDIFEFWSQVSEDACVHPADKLVLERCDHQFNLDCRPGPFMGPLRTAPVVLLFLSPGFVDEDVVHSASPDGKNYYLNQWTGNFPLPSKGDHPSAYKWLKKIIGQFGIDYEQASTKVATVNIGAYKSEHYKDWPMLAALPSSRVCLDWAQSVLFPQAEANERVVVCLRSPKYWGLSAGKSEGSLFSPTCLRNAIMRKGDLRKQVAEAVNKAVQV